MRLNSPVAFGVYTLSLFTNRLFMTRTTLLIVTLALCLLAAGSASAQTGIARDTTHWNDEDIYTDGAVSHPGYGWIGAGFVAGALMTNLNDFNTNVSMPFIHQNLSQTIAVFGGQIFFPLPWVKNLRVGGVGFSGRSQICCVPDTTSAGQPTMRTLRYSVGYGGLTLDYSLPIYIKHCHVLAGLELGIGSQTIWAKQAAARSSFDISSEFDAPSTNITHSYSSSLFVYKPQVTFEWAPMNYLMLRVSAGYQGTSVGTWYADEDVPLGSTSGLSSTKGGGFIANAGIYLGIFQ